MRSIEMRKELTDEWQRSGISEKRDFAILTNVLTQAYRLTQKGLKLLETLNEEKQ